MSFYVTLPSNGSMGLFPDNNPTKFSIKLPQTIEVNNQYEVGLAEIQFPNSYFNVRKDEVWVRYYQPETEENGDCEKREHVLITLPPGLYTSVESFIEELNKALLSQDAAMEIYYNKAAKQAGVRLYHREAKVALSESIKNILALPSRHITGNQPHLVGDDMADLDRDMRNIYVYTDIVAARCVGDAMVPLLRTVPIIDRTGTSGFRLYDKPHYLPLSRFSFDTVEVLLTNDRGQKIPFTTGTSVVTLHFRKRSRFELD